MGTMTAFGIFHRLFAHAGLINAAPQYPVAKKDIIEQRVLLGKGGPFAGNHVARPVHIAHLLNYPNHKQVMTGGDINADKTGAIGIVFGDTRQVMLYAVNQLIGEPGGGFIQPLQFKLLRPRILVVQGGTHVGNIARQPFTYRLVDIHHMARPDGIQGRIGHQFIEFVAFAVRGGGDAQPVAVRYHRKQRRPDFAAVGMKGKLIEKHIGGKAARRIRVRRECGNTRAAGQHRL
ncbi:unnamed protein product [Bemisia tabaci]|uniref:Uncharacterized protein n=1 Tax=Bemisia tabaci TaxID=7038 RepID=A0A9P0ALC0_BEMTA|nr:unnamed protein product [Bemisia tabaci]